MTFKPGANVRLAKRAEQFYSIIADGKELITKDSKGILIVPELNDGNVKMAFKPDVTAFFDTFFGCENLTSIPGDLFANNPAATHFGYTLDELIVDMMLLGNPDEFMSIDDMRTRSIDDMRTRSGFEIPGLFANCISLTNIPENLFANNPEVRHFGTMFAATGITSIPENLFANNSKVKHFGPVFAATGITSIPENLFANNPDVTDFDGTFSLCESLTSVPENLFANNSKVKHFGLVTEYKGSYLGYAIGLAMPFQSVPITSIPENLFANNPDVTNFDGTFYGCENLTHIPAGLFDNNKNVINFYYTFGYCTAAQNESPYTMIGDKKVHLYERKNYPSQFTTPTPHNACFYDCTNLTDYAQIPEDWK